MLKRIWKIRKDFSNQLWDESKKDVSFNERDHAVETLGTVSGNWIDSLEIDGKK